MAYRTAYDIALEPASTSKSPGLSTTVTATRRCRMRSIIFGNG